MEYKSFGLKGLTY